jgi:hypothetical protein
MASRQRGLGGQLCSVPEKEVSMFSVWPEPEYGVWLTPMLGPSCARVSPGNTLSATAESTGFS